MMSTRLLRQEQEDINLKATAAGILARDRAAAAPYIEQGRAAFAAGVSLENRPKSLRYHDLWIKGWMAAQAKAAQLQAQAGQQG